MPWNLVVGCVRDFESQESFELKPCVRKFDVPPGEVDDGEAIDEVMRDVDRDLARMQTDEFADAARAANDATPEEMGAAAVKAAKPHFQVHFCTCGRDGRPVTWRCEGTDPPRTYVQRR